MEAREDTRVLADSGAGWTSEHWVPRELEPQAGQRWSLRSLPMGRKHGRGQPAPQGLGCATRNMLGQRAAGTPRGTGNVGCW